MCIRNSNTCWNFIYLDFVLHVKQNYFTACRYSLFRCSLSMFCHVLSLEETPALCWPQVREGLPVVSMFIYMVHRNFSTPDTVISGMKREVKKEEELNLESLVNLLPILMLHLMRVYYVLMTNTTVNCGNHQRQNCLNFNY